MKFEDVLDKCMMIILIETVIFVNIAIFSLILYGLGVI